MKVRTVHSTSSNDLQSASRTCYCGQVTEAMIDSPVVLKGWAHYRRDHGGVIFIDLRDREGLAQLVFDPENLPAEKFETAHRFHLEDVLAIRGTVRRRPAGSENKNLATGTIEIFVSDFEVLSQSRPLPFQVDDHATVSEDHRLRYRYLDLRRPRMQHNMKMRSRVMGAARRYLDSQGLYELDTPILTRSTPEGARDFLVPSRLNPGTFYALPQSPQLFKQLFMISGFDGYYQIARCFRDEDLRANRQPEFTQIDIERSFITREDIYNLMEGMVAAIFREAKGIELSLPFRRMSYHDSMLRFGSDKPDLRFGLEIQDVTAIFKSGCEFKVFNAALEAGGAARALRVPGGAAKYSKTQLKPGGELPDHAQRHGAGGLAWFAAEKTDGALALNSNITKFFKPECLSELLKATSCEEGDLLLIIVDRAHVAANAMGQMRLKIGRDFDLIDDNALEFCWITDFPLVEWDDKDKRYYAMNHPFTAPHPDDLDRLESDPASVRALAYDLSLNGEEIGGGSLRIHRSDLQMRAFKVLSISEEEARERFRFLLEALEFGAPPHGGIAFGLDRLMMIILGTDSIRDVIPFPKTQSGACLLTDAPSPVDDIQLRDLALRSTVKKKEAPASGGGEGGAKPAA